MDQKTPNELHVQREKRGTKVDFFQKRGWLKNGNPPGDFTKAPRCGARTRKESACRQPAMKNGRCRLHGGKSTGPKTKEGLENSRTANLHHGHYSQESKQRRAYYRAVLREAKEMLEALS